MRKFIALILLFVVTVVVAYFLEEKNKKNDHELVLFGNVNVRQVDLGFRVSGRVNEMFFNEGDLVQPNTLMGYLDKEPYLDQIRQAEAAAKSLSASLENAKILFQRRSNLVVDGSVSQEDFDTALANVYVLTANHNNAEAALAVAKTNLAFTEVYAPTEGTILTRIREPGTVVNPGDPIYTLSVLNPVWVRAFVAEPQLGLIYPGMPATIYTDTKTAPY